MRNWSDMLLALDWRRVLAALVLGGTVLFLTGALHPDLRKNPRAGQQKTVWEASGMKRDIPLDGKVKWARAASEKPALLFRCCSGSFR